MSYIGILPINVRRHPYLSPLAKVLYAEITASMEKDMSFTLGNTELAEIYMTTPKIISSAISELSAREFIDVQVDGNNRKIYLPEKMIFVSEEKKPKEKDEKLSSFAEAVIDFWNRNVGCKRRANPNIKAMIKARLKSYSEHDIWAAVMNRATFVNESEWHNKPENLHHKTNITLVLRNDESLEKAMNVMAKKTINSVGITKIQVL